MQRESDGRLKRSAGSSPSTRLVTKHMATHCRNSQTSGLNSSSSGPHRLNAHAIAGGAPKSRGGREAAAQHRHDQRLAQVVLHQAPAARADGVPDCQLALVASRRGPASSPRCSGRRPAARSPTCRTRSGVRSPRDPPASAPRAGKYGSIPPVLSRWLAGNRSASAAITERTLASACARRVPSPAAAARRSRVPNWCRGADAGVRGRGQAGVTRQRQPELVPAVAESGQVMAVVLRRDADDNVVGLVDRDRAPDDVGVAPETRLPHPMADDRFPRRCERRIVGRGCEPWPGGSE